MGVAPVINHPNQIGRDAMKRVLAGLMSAFAIATFAVATVEAQTPSCPPEVAKAKQQLNLRSAKGQDIQAPRSLAGARQIESPRGQDIQSPRGQDIQSPRGQDIQSPRSLAGARPIESPRGQDIQPPRGQDIQSPRGQDIQSPRGHDIQSPRGQDIQSPRGQDIQSPRGQDIQSPRGQDVQSPRSLAGSKAGASKAFNLVKEAEAACAKGDMTTAKAKAEAALAEMK